MTLHAEAIDIAHPHAGAIISQDDASLIGTAAVSPPCKWPDVMLDTETLGTRPGCDVLSIAAVGFDLATGETDPEPCYIRFGLPERGHIKGDADTLRWWLQQPESVRAEAFEPDRTRVCCDGQGIERLIDYVSRRTKPGANIWAWGTTFDIPIIEAAIEEEGFAIEMPWQFRQVRDARTLCAIAGIKRDFLPHERPHHPIDDCRIQIRAVVLAAAPLLPRALDAGDIFWFEDDNEFGYDSMDDIAKAIAAHYIGTEKTAVVPITRAANLPTVYAAVRREDEQGPEQASIRHIMTLHETHDAAEERLAALAAESDTDTGGAHV